MKEQMVSYKVAKLAKEKGFNIESDKYYCIVPIEEQKVGDVVLEEETYTHIAMGKGEAVWFRYAPIASQALLQKWLREVHHIYVVSISSNVDESDNKKHMYEISYKNKLRLMWGKYDYFDTYEDALEAGLTEAIKLIDNDTIKSKS